MKRLIHNGTKFTLVECGEDKPPQIGDMPRKPQKAAYSHRGMPNRMRDFKPIKSGNGYKPGPLLDLGFDQCRYFISAGIMCGEKVGHHPSYCEHHRSICCTGVPAFNSQRMKRVANGTHKEGWTR